MKFRVVPADMRNEVIAPPRSTRSPWVAALIDGQTIVISKEDRRKIGGNTKTLRNHGLRLRSGRISESEVVVWAEPLEPESK